MRTHLLRTFYPPPAIEPETGFAANDELFATPLVPALAAVIPQPQVTTVHTRDDDYQLGGYAGI